MQQYKIISTLLSLPIVILLFGCNDTSIKSSINKTTTQTESNSFIRPEKKADLTGKIKNIVGNEITIEVRDMTKLPSEIKEMMPTNNGNVSFGGGGGGMPGSNQVDEETRKKIRAAMEKIERKEHKIIFPIGIPMGQESLNNIEESSLSDLKIGSRVNVWLNKNISDRVIAETVIISSRQGNMR